MNSTTYERHGDTAVITLNNPPVNSLGHDVRVGIANGLDRADADELIKSIILIGSDKMFSGGADIREFDTPQAAAEPNLGTLINIVDSSSKPVIAAIGGVCMGGALELALSMHFRIAKKDASIALPEVKLGLLPGAGGTQRLPRLIGVEAATNFIVAGNPLPAEKFEGTALFDELVDDDLLAAALSFAERIVSKGLSIKRVRDIHIEYENQQAYFQFARNMVRGVSGPFPAPLKCIDAVQAAVTKPFDEGLRAEWKLFMELMQTPESRALRHSFFGERAASKIPDIDKNTPTRSIDKVGVIGAGTMGCGIAMNFANAGLPVNLVETKQAALDKGIATIRGNYERSQSRGKISQEDVEQRMTLISGSLSIDELCDCDMIIEAVFEDIGVKEEIFKKLDAIAKPGAILATNTSTLDVDRIANVTARAQDVVGMHFFSPANVMKLLEVVRGVATAKDVMATVMRVARKIGKTAVVSGVCEGFIGNRMLEQYVKAASYLIVNGATPWQVDKALEKWGMAMGPFRMGDLAGNDIPWAIRKGRYAENPPEFPDVADRLCELGRFGQKTGKGWYLYRPNDRNAIPDPVVEDMLKEYRVERGIKARNITDEEIVERCIYALVNEGACILEDGIAARASDIDVVYLTGYGFPLQRGGPMCYADEEGLYGVARKIREFAVSGDPFKEPAALILQRVAEGRPLT